MTVLYAYLIAGFCVSAALVLLRMRSEGVAVKGRAVGKELAAIIVGALLWPVLLWLKVRETIGGRSGKAETAENRFTVLPADLLMISPVLEVERKERITDPLNAVPPVPFGHLYPAWLRFKAGMHKDATLWSFESTWTSNWGRRDRRRGYVVVDAHGRIGEHFVAEVERLVPPR